MRIVEAYGVTEPLPDLWYYVLLFVVQAVVAVLAYRVMKPKGKF